MVKVCITTNIDIARQRFVWPTQLEARPIPGDFIRPLNFLTKVIAMKVEYCTWVFDKYGDGYYLQVYVGIDYKQFLSIKDFEQYVKSQDCHS